jgi:hypothetical protein
MAPLNPGHLVNFWLTMLSVAALSRSGGTACRKQTPAQEAVTTIASPSGASTTLSPLACASSRV